MSEPRRVVIVSTMADEYNVNEALRTYIGEGFTSVLGAGNVVVAAERSLERVMAAHEPHLVLATGSVMRDDTDLSFIRRSANRYRALLAVWQHDDPYELDFAYRTVDVADVIFSNDRGSVPYYRHPRVHHLPLAASPTVHFRPIVDEQTYDLFFCGAGYANRQAFFNDLDDEQLAPYRVLVTGSGWPPSRFFENRRIPNGVLPDMYAASLCTVTLGRDLDLGNRRYQVTHSTPGPRTFEAAMAGCVQLYFATGLEVLDYFDPAREIILIDSASEIPELLRTLRSDSQKLRALRTATQERALRDHTYANRAKVILDVCFPSI